MPAAAVMALAALAVVLLGMLIGLQWVWLAWRLDRLELELRAGFRRPAIPGAA